MEDEIRITGLVPEMLHIYLPRQPFRSLSGEEGYPDLDAATVAYRTGRDDPWITQVGRSIVAELVAESASGRLLIETAGLALAAASGPWTRHPKRAVAVSPRLRARSAAATPCPRFRGRPLRCGHHGRRPRGSGLLEPFPLPARLQGRDRRDTPPVSQRPSARSRQGDVATGRRLPWRACPSLPILLAGELLPSVPTRRGHEPWGVPSFDPVNERWRGQRILRTTESTSEQQRRFEKHPMSPGERDWEAALSGIEPDRTIDHRGGDGAVVGHGRPGR